MMTVMETLYSGMEATVYNGNATMDGMHAPENDARESQNTAQKHQNFKSPGHHFHDAGGFMAPCPLWHHACLVL